MATSKDIAKIIASQHNIKAAEAENFIQQLVDTINEGIESDRLVKIKGFGTFKMQSVKSRSSINVNTGERVVIGEHDRITFLPDASMKNAINKPFAHFETVEIADGSPLLDEIASSEDDTDDEDLKDDEAVMEEEPVAEEPVVEEKSVAEEPAPVKAEPKPVVKEEPKPVVEEEPVEEKPVEKKPVSVMMTEDDEPESISERMQGQGNVFIGIAAGILIVIAAIFGFSKYNGSKTTVAPAAAPQTIVADTAKNDTLKKDTMVLGTESATQVADDDTTSVDNKKSKRRGRKHRRHRRRR